jgi:hypothetical protein
VQNCVKRTTEIGNIQQVVLGHITEVLKTEKLDQQTLSIWEGKKEDYNFKLNERMSTKSGMPYTIQECYNNSWIIMLKICYAMWHKWVYCAGHVVV